MLVNNPIPVTEGTLRNMARQARDEIDHIYLHWTAGHYGQVYDDYHLCIDRDGTVYVNCKALDEYKAHTFGRNTGAIGIACAAARRPAAGCRKAVQAMRPQKPGRTCSMLPPTAPWSTLAQRPLRKTRSK